MGSRQQTGRACAAPTEKKEVGKEKNRGEKKEFAKSPFDNSQAEGEDGMDLKG